MAINFRVIRLLFTAFLFAGLSPFLLAQTQMYYVDMDSEHPRFTQRLTWSGGENALRFEIEIERIERGRYVSHVTETSEERFIDVSLQPGVYRYRVVAFDFLGRPGAESAWMYLEVRQALMPEITGFSFEIAQINDVQFDVLKIEGRNLLPDSQILFFDEDGDEIESDETAVLSGGESLRLYFEHGRLRAGKYRILIKATSGLEGQLDNINFVPVKQMVYEPDVQDREPEFNASFAWMPVLPVYGKYYGEDLVLGGAISRISVGFSLPANTYIGPEITFGWNYSDPITAGCNLLITKHSPSRFLAINLRLGAEYTVYPEKENSFYFLMGASFSLRFAELFKLEWGLDYAHSLPENTSGALRPWIGIGIR
jgi:hypothetical protein